MDVVPVLDATDYIRIFYANDGAVGNEDWVPHSEHTTMAGQSAHIPASPTLGFGYAAASNQGDHHQSCIDNFRIIPEEV